MTDLVDDWDYETAIVRTSNGYLTRFRADPDEVRISIRREGAKWRATVTSRDGIESLFHIEEDPKEAVKKALRAANLQNFLGVDLGMECSYPHPWGSMK